MQTLKLYESHPNGPVEIGWDFSGTKHSYYLLPEMTPITANVTGVTDKISVGDKTGMLMGWAVEEAMNHLDENWPAVIAEGQKLARLELSESQFQEIIKAAKGAHRRKKKDAATVGGDAHDWIDKHIKAQVSFGEAPPMPTEPRVLNAVQAYLAFESDRRVHYVASERKVYSRKYGYVGTLDRLVVIDGVLGIEDLKTSNSWRNEYACQISAYEMAYMEEFPESKIEKRLGIMLSKEEVEFEVIELPVEQREEDFAAFLGALEVFRWGEKLKDRG
jgi:hypothetical protein